MLTPREKKGCKEVLELLPEEELQSLAMTVTAQQLILTSRNEAIEAVLTYTQDAKEFLKRKKVKREYLFRYMAQHKLAASPTSEKYQLITVILQFWKEDLERREDPPPRHIRTEIGENRIPNELIRAESTQESVAENTHTTSEEQLMALAFAQWFFQLLNSQNPASRIVTDETFGTHHFYPDCRMNMISATPQITKDSFHGSELIVKRLTALVMEERLYFSPNISEQGVRGMTEPHGLRMVLVCGTIHQEGNPIGVFEQQFGLVCEPVSQHWKIKFTNLKIGCGVLGHTPTLQETQERLSIEAS